MQIQRSQRIDDSLTLVLATFGSQETYECVSLNISTSGILLACPATVPFNTTTILEVTIDPKGEKLSRAIRCNGRIVRIAKGNSKGLQKYKDYFGANSNFKSVLGIFLTEISNQDLALWHQYVDALHDTFPR